jgi:PPM family protein phosphatase
MCWFTPGWMHFGHIGDSRIYYLPGREGGIKQLSHDDTHVGWLLRTGRIKEWEARMHPRRKVLQRALGGSNQFVEPQVGAVAYEPGDIFLLCTDGLVEGLHDYHVVERLRSTEPKQRDANVAHQLVLESLEKGCRDNTTALVIEVM